MIERAKSILASVRKEFNALAKTDKQIFVMYLVMIFIIGALVGGLLMKGLLGG